MPTLLKELRLYFLGPGWLGGDRHPGTRRPRGLEMVPGVSGADHLLPKASILGTSKFIFSPIMLISPYLTEGGLALAYHLG